MSEKINSNIKYLFFIFVLIYLLYLAMQMILPFANALFMAAIFVGSFLPLHRKMTDRFKLKKTSQAFLTTSIIFVIAIVPISLIMTQLINESIALYSEIRQGAANEILDKIFSRDGKISQAVMWLNEKGIDLDIPSLKQKILATAQTSLSGFIKYFNGVVQNIFQFLFHFIVMLVAIYVFLAKGDLIKRFFFDLSPLPDDEEELILEKFNQMNYVTMYGNGIGGVIQGVLAGAGLWIAGIESIFLWTTLMIFLAFIPLVGISIVFIPICIYLWIKGHILASIVLFIYCSLVAFVVENVYKPKFMGSQIKLDSMLLLLFILGGLSTFGMFGIFYGPIICILILTVIDIYKNKYQNIT
jgi:predicted PurR-regulated permease PerM